MPTQIQYDAATEAVLAELRADISRSVPAFLRSQIPDTTVVHYAGVIARLAVDAAEKVAPAPPEQHLPPGLVVDRPAESAPADASAAEHIPSGDELLDRSA